MFIDCFQSVICVCVMYVLTKPKNCHFGDGICTTSKNIVVAYLVDMYQINCYNRIKTKVPTPGIEPGPPG